MSDSLPGLRFCFIRESIPARSRSTGDGFPALLAAGLLLTNVGCDLLLRKWPFFSLFVFVIWLQVFWAEPAVHTHRSRSLDDVNGDDDAAMSMD
jgi:hypothetical protein